LERLTMTTTTPVVLITGALTGIGRATAFAFARSGARLVVSGRREAEGAALIAELNGLGAEAIFVPADVRHEADIAALVAKTLDAFGRLDVAVNNAGTEGQGGPITAVDEAVYHSVFETNVKGVLLSMKHELPPMVAQGSGSIINLSSLAGHVGFAGASIYVASKHAVEGLTRSAALEVAGFGVRVNAVAPGPIQTDMLDRFTGRSAEMKAGFLGMVPAKRAGTVEEVASTIVYLASAGAAFITGQIVSMDGGLSAQ